MSTVLLREEVRRCAGELIVCGIAGSELDGELRDLLRQVAPLGICLFKRNVASAAAIQALCAELKSHLAPRPLLISVDQEGGRVARLGSPLTAWPPLRALGALSDEAAATALGAALAVELRAVNVDVDFAPVLDVDTNPQNPVIGDRAIAAEPQAVARLGAAFVRGMQAGGVAACAKHFPGHGDTDLDSHLALPHLAHDLARLRQVEWPPFAAAIAAGVSSIMTAHVVLDAVEPGVPATLSAQLLRTHLRKELGFEGVIVGDDTEMKALADHFSPTQIVVDGLRAGLDLFLPCHGYAATLEIYENIVRAAEDSSQVQTQLAAAAARTTAWRHTWAKPARHGPIGPWPAHEVLAARLRQG